MLWTRRHLIGLAGIGAGLAAWRPMRGFGGQEFWNAKDPEEWSADEIAKLLKKSPWAKEVTGQRTSTNKNPTMSTDPMGTSIPNPSGRSRNPGIGSTRNPNRIPNSGSNKTVTTYRGTVVWESAKVIRDAAKWDLPAGFESQYVLSVTGIPLAKSSSKNAMDGVRQVSMLESKGHDPLGAATVQQKQDNSAIYFIGFAREGLAIAKDDKEVVFTTRMGRVAFTAKFNPREMLYHGKLAV